MSFKVILSVLLALIIVLCIGTAGFFGYAAYSKSCKLQFTIDENDTRQTFSGFGASACWWSQVAGDSENSEAAVKYLYSKDGLGLNIYRYNIGGGSKDNDGCRFSENTWRTTESFLYFDESDGNYKLNFNRDKNAQNILNLALSYGCVDTVILFANSPHFSMTANGQTECGAENNLSNLPEENYQKYAEYFLDITEHFLNEGVPGKYISPINEPQWGWGGESVSQEGCHYTPEEAAKLLGVFAREIEKRGLNVKLSGLESGNIGDTAKKYYELLSNDEITMRNLGSYCYHSYFSDNKTKQKENFGKWASENIDSSLSFDMSEWCELPCERKTDDFGSAVHIAKIMANDISLSGVNSWSAWVGVNGRGTKDNETGYYSDGLLNANDDFSDLAVSARYYGMAHFSKYVPENSVVIGCEKNITDLDAREFKLTDSNTWKNSFVNSSCFKSPDGDIILVLSNSGKQRDIIIDKTAKNMRIIESDENEKLNEVYSGDVKSELTLKANSVTTIIYSK